MQEQLPYLSALAKAHISLPAEYLLMLNAHLVF